MIKSVIFDLAGNEIASMSVATPLSYLKGGWVEQDMKAVWDAAKRSIKGVLRKAKVEAKNISGISISGQGAGLWMIDRKGMPVRNAVNWLDLRASFYVKKWVKEGLHNQMYEISGSPQNPGWTGPILRWFKDNKKNVLEKAYAIIWCKDWIKYCLTGDICTDFTDPSCVGLIDPNKNGYSKRILELMGIDCFEPLLPKLTPSYHVAGETCSETVEIGLRKGIPVASGAHDTTATPLGAGCHETRDAFSIIGTAGIHGMVLDKPKIDVSKTCILQYHCVPGRWTMGSWSQLAAGNLDWFLDNFFKDLSRLNKEEFYGLINKWVAEVPVGAYGIIFLPFLSGERGPFVKPEAKAVFFGLASETRREHLLRAVYEGVAFSALHNYEAIERGSQMKIKTVRLMGGGARSSIWCKILSDCLGARVIVPEGTEFGAKGVAINVAVALKLYRDHNKAVDEMVRKKEEYKPNKKNMRKYKEIYGLYKALIDALWKVWEVHSTLKW